ncbi:hypothetical protein PM082_001871 [Marasmius tenuissimus]|nr:hypothetical protein PM082_001871 [Marasmius tenuissimus]
MSQRIEVVFTAVARMIARDPQLFVQAQDARQGVDYFVLQSIRHHNSENYEKFLQIAENIDAYTARRAVEDFYLGRANGMAGDDEEDDPGSAFEPNKYIKVLGLPLFRERYEDALPFWGHILAMSQCVVCIRETVASVKELADLYHFLEVYQLPVVLDAETQIKADHVLRLCGLVLTFSEDRLGHPPKNVASTQDGLKETQSAVLVGGAMASNEIHGDLFLEGCLQHPDFRVIIRRNSEI